MSEESTPLPVTDGSPPAVDQKPHFEIHASVVFQLGEDLITDAVQAVVELVKNCYDADSEYSRVTVVTDSPHEVKDSFYPDAQGYVLIEDGGSGMTEEDIRRGWLTISNSHKREMKRQGRRTPLKGRTPLGDKGLGRLGVQRLGSNVEIFTRPRGENVEYHVGWSWDDFLGESTLSDVQIRFTRSDGTQRQTGTTLLISGLREPDYWRGTDAFTEFEQQLSQMISPYGNFQDFLVTGAVNGKEFELASITENVRKLAQVRYELSFDGERFRIKGKSRLSFLRPRNGVEDLAAFDQLVSRDAGSAFFAFLLKQKHASQWKFHKSVSADWFVEYEEERELKDIPHLDLLEVPSGTAEALPHGNPLIHAHREFSSSEERNDKTSGSRSMAIERVPANPGPFRGEIDAFDLSAEIASAQSVFDSAAEYKQYIKTMNGVRVYRDGFGIRVDRDWLGLGKQWTTAKSYYGLKPENTLGYIALTARDNGVLVETTDREGFKVVPQFSNFMALMTEFVKFAHDVQEFLRRGWLEFRAANKREEAEIDSSASPERLSRELDAGLAKALALEGPLGKTQTTLETAARRAGETLNDLVLTKSSSQIVRVEEVDRLNEVNTLLQVTMNDARQLFVGVREFIAETSRLQKISTVLQSEMEALKEQLAQAYETISLGLTAEALSHEIHNIVDQMAQRTQELLRYLAKNKINDAKVFAYTEYLKTTITGLRKQLSHLAPSLRVVRERRDVVPLQEFLDEIADYYRSRWVDESMHFRIVSGERELSLLINRGKLTQIVDNIVLNSEYWLREDLRVGRIQEGVVFADISNPPIVRIGDNGSGIDPAIEHTLFEPFVTRKTRGKGRGLGLFIVRQLLDTEGCNISLSPQRNHGGRRFEFLIDFSGCINGTK